MPATMTFGKYRDRPVSAVPTSYLRWVSDNLRDLHPPLRRAILAELYARGEADADDLRDHGDQADRPAALPCEVFFRQVYGEMARRYHPDRGGSAEAMEAVNAVFDRLNELATQHAGAA